jgi:glycosyltransferase involved in cell wall biosynthesis
MNDDVVAIVIGRHTEKPLTEGGGIIARQTAKALSRVGFPTWLISINYSKGIESREIEVSGENAGNEIPLKIKFLLQDDVLNDHRVAVLSNLVEFAATPLMLVKLIKKLRKNYRNLYIFIVNASKLVGAVLAYLSKHFSSRVTKVYVLTQREELYRETLRIIKPDIILATSKELQLLAFKSATLDVTNILFTYPPILDEPKSRLESERYRNKELILLYLGRVNEKRFPIVFFKNIAKKLKESKEELKLIIATPPEKPSIFWLLKAKNIVEEFNLADRVIFVPRILREHEKNMLLRKASIFIYPSITTAAVEPPLSVLEAMSYGQYLITTGSTSTRELVIQTRGFISKDFSDLNLENCIYIANQARDIILSWSRTNLSMTMFMKTIKSIMDTN